jgi:thiosulfate dehydrogenase [quinone] large subunit
MSTTADRRGTMTGNGVPAQRPGEAASATRPTAVELTQSTAARYVFAGVRIALGWTFLWAFLDKMFGLGFATESKDAWIDGGHPTFGFLNFGATGPFESFYKGIAGDAWADWLFMIGLLGIGIALLAGIGMRIAATTGALLYVLMWSVALPPENNPFMDEHLIFAAVLVGLALIGAGDTLGFGRQWARLPLVQRMPWLR